MSVGAITPTHERRQFVDFLMPYQNIDTTFTTYLKPPAPDVFLAFRPLTLATSLTTLATWIVSCMVLFLFLYKYIPRVNRILVILHIAIDMIGALFKQSKYLQEFCALSGSTCFFFPDKTNCTKKYKTCCMSYLQYIWHK